MTDAEQFLWSKIRGKQLRGYQFYRQKIIGNYIVDFYCPKSKLVIEVDGGQHYDEEGCEKDLNKYFEEYGLYGGYPEVVKAEDSMTKNIILKNIYDTYVTKDIIELLRIGDIDTFRKIVMLLANQAGDLLNHQNLMREAGTYFKQIKQHLSVLEETYIIRHVRPYYKNKTTELKKNQKIYFVDTGLRNYTINNFNRFAIRGDSGAMVENIVLSQIDQNDYRDIFFWRTAGKAEVDFIIQYQNELIPIEVKYSALNSPKISRSFKNFISAYKPSKAIILTKGTWPDIKIDTTLVKFIPVWYV